MAGRGPGAWGWAGCTATPHSSSTAQSKHTQPTHCPWVAANSLLISDTEKISLHTESAFILLCRLAEAQAELEGWRVKFRVFLGAQTPNHSEAKERSGNGASQVKLYS